MPVRARIADEIMLALLTVSLIWAFSFGLIGNTLAGIDPWFLAFARLGISALIFTPFMRLGGLPRNRIIEFCAIGAVQYGFMYAALFLGFRFIESHEVALFTILTPIYVTLINDLFQKQFHPLFLVSAVIAVAGTALIKFQQIKSADVWIGFGIIQVANICFAVGQIWYRNIMKRIGHKKNREVFALLYIGAAMSAALFSLLLSDWSEIHMRPIQVNVIVYLGVVASGVGFFLWNIGARKVNAGTLAVFNNLKIPLAIAVSIIFFQEKTSIPNLLIGLTAILAALAMDEHKRIGSAKH